MRVWKITRDGCINGEIVDVITSDDYLTPEQVLSTWNLGPGRFFGSYTFRAPAIEALHVRTPSREQRIKQLQAEIAELIASDSDEGEAS